ncbi:hypothetical protein QFC20_002381 [Naganishia adeliensis]|uniref:Uncharacterized protein n=1 Tax=Naganishia adeliensis TaxID=92952 RepID=A0ACC2WM21_9TREE|nr:hypothetical protein QFC20_002381 [Naganishia adeliensis]
MWFFGCGNRRKSGMADISTSRYPVAPGGMAPSFYYPQQPYTYGMPHPPQYAAPPRAPRRDAIYSQAPGPPSTYYTASRKTSSYANTPAFARSGMTYTVTTQPTNAPAPSRRKVTFGRVDVREFRGGGRGGT